MSYYFEKRLLLVDAVIQKHLRFILFTNMDNLISEKCSWVVRNFLCFLGKIVLEFGRTWSCVVQASLDLVVKSRMASNF